MNYGRFPLCKAIYHNCHHSLRGSEEEEEEQEAGNGGNWPHRRGCKIDSETEQQEMQI